MRKIVLIGLFIAMTVAFQMLGFPQLITGPVVNSMLLLSALFTGAIGGVLVGIVTPWVAFVRGSLLPPLAPMIPFIMAGNAAYALSFYFCLRKLGDGAVGSSGGVVLGSLVKFILLSGAVRFLVSVPAPVAQAMQFPQLITALLGGALAFPVAKMLKRPALTEAPKTS